MYSRYVSISSIKNIEEKKNRYFFISTYHYIMLVEVIYSYTLMGKKLDFSCTNIFLAVEVILSECTYKRTCTENRFWSARTEKKIV